MAENEMIEAKPTPTALATQPITVEQLFDRIGNVVDGGLACSNFKGDPMELYKLDSLARGAGSESGSSMIGKEIAVKYWYVHPCATEGAKGEIQEFPRTVLITPQDVAYSFGSQGVFDAVRLLARHFGDKVLDPPLIVEVREVKTRRGMKMLTLVPKAFGKS